MKLSSANITLVLRVFAGILVASSALPAAAQQRPLTAVDFPKVVPKIDESLLRLKGKDITERLLLMPYDGSALRLALDKTSPEFLKGTTVEELITELSALRAESMKQLLPEILAPLDNRGAAGVRTQVPGAMLHHRTQEFMLVRTVHPLAFLTTVYVKTPPQSYGAPLEGRSEFPDNNYSLTVVNEYEYVAGGITVNVREEITWSTDTRYIRFRHVKRETVDQNDDPKAVERYIVEQGTINSPGTNELKSVHPRRLQPTSTHRVTTELFREAKVERCPNADGITRGETLVSKTIRGTADAMSNGAPLFIEIASPGKVTGFVDAAATLTGFDWEVSAQSRMESLNAGENFRLAQTRLGGLRNMEENGKGSTENAVLGELVVSGVGTTDGARKVLSLQDAAIGDAAGPLLDVLDKAEAEWRGGKCVELVVPLGTEYKVRPGVAQRFVVEGRHRYESPPLAVPVTATAAGGTLTPTTPVPTPSAAFTFKSDKDGGAVTLKSVSRRGIAKDVMVRFMPIGRIPIKVSVSYFQNETITQKRATLPGVDVEGGNEIEETNMSHTSILYHYPSLAALEKGYLVAVEKDKPFEGSKTEHFLEVGHFNYTKKVEDAKIFVIIGDKRAQADVEKGSMSNYNGTASLKHPSQMFFFKGDANTPPQFWWHVEYPASNGEDIAAGSIGLVKGDESVKWTVTKITDPDSPYKTEYLLELNLDAAEELKEGNKAMKDLFGFDLDGLTKAIDPTKPKDNMAGASGSQTIMVRILSPYEDK